MKPVSATMPVASVTRTLLVAMSMAIFFTLLGWSQSGNPFNVDPVASTDDMVRMVTVREWLGGQSWYDPVLHRLGPSTGTVMHWSRLIDLPLGILVLTGNALGFDGERVAAIVWPFLMLIAAAAGFLVATRRASGSNNLVPVLVIGGFALAGANVFDSGTIDHHNVQLALTIWLVAMLTPGGMHPVRDLSIAAVLTSLMLAVGMEGLPLAIAGALAVYLRLNTEGGSFIPAARAYGLTLAITLCALFVILIAPSRYGQAYCDAFSLFHLVSAAIGGLVLWAGLHPGVRHKLFRPRIVVPLLAAAAVALTTALFFPDCLGNPIARLDPKLREFWIDKVIETQNIFQIARLDPWLLPYMHVLPLIALVAGSIAMVTGRPRSPVNAIIIFVVISTAVTLFQMRGTQFAMPLAALALAMMVTRYAETGGKHKARHAVGEPCLFLPVCLENPDPVSHRHFFRRQNRAVDQWRRRQRQCQLRGTLGLDRFDC